MNSRTNFTVLPSVEELQKILAAEATRAVPAEKLGVHYPEFGTLIRLLDYYALPHSFFDSSANFEELTSQNFIEDLNTSAQELTQNLLNDASPPQEILHSVYDYLSEEDVPEPADMLFVFGAKTPARAQKAVELYNQGLAPTVCISGGNPFYKEHPNTTEAKNYKHALLEAGVPEEAIVLEDASITIPDNVRRSLNLFDATKQQVNSIILVNSPYVQRRGWVHFKKYLSDSVELYRVNSKTIDTYSRDGWHHTPAGVQVLYNEFVKMKVAVSLNTA